MERWFPSFLEQAPDKVRELFHLNTIPMRWQAGDMLAYEGAACTHFFIVISGNIRVYKPGDRSREITLYHVREEQSCILTGFCLLSHNSFPAFAIAETDVEAVLIPADLLREWVGRFDSWRGFLFDTMAMRLADILSTLEKTLFQRLDVRIARMLLELMDGDENTVHITHAELARELNSSRVAISRLLEKLSADNVLSQQRGKIHVLDISSLQKIAASV